jgi:uncharacterized membrane protein YphA (DoxX/SURF4 family)
VLLVASLVSGLGFLIYGFQCLVSPFMKAEFERFQVPHYRVLTGILEILGGIGVITGHFVPLIGALAAAGLCILMAMGVVTRIRVKDSAFQCLPASFFCFLNGLIAIQYFEAMSGNFELFK